MADIMLMGKNPNYIGAYDLYDLDVKEITVTIKNFREEEVVTNGKSEACAVMYFEEDFKPMIVNPTNKKVLAKLFHSKLTEKMVGYMNELGGLKPIPDMKANASEDFAVIASAVPSAFMYLSAGFDDERGEPSAHNPKVCFNEAVLPIGAAALAHCAARWLEEK